MMAGLHGVLQAIGEQALSVSIRESAWTYPVIESIHVLTIAVFVGFAVLLDLRLMGRFLTSKPVSRVTAALLPRTELAFVVMVMSGALLFYAKPMETAYNPFFQAKLAVIAMALLNVAFYHGIAISDISAWDRDAIPPAKVRASGLLSLSFWVIVVVCGRLIAYNWFK